MTLNPMSAVQPQPSANKQAGTTPEKPFNQMLAGEIAHRRSTGNADASSQSAAEGESAALARPENSASAQSKPAEEAADGERKDSETAPVSAELLAIVANFSQTAASAQPEDSSATPDTSLSLNPGHARNKGKHALSAQVDLQALPGRMQSTELASLGTDSRMPAALLQANESRTALDFNAAKTPELLSAGTSATGMAPLQSAALAMTQLSPGHMPEKLSPPVGSAAWDQALGQKVVWMTAGGQQTASLTLNPPDLGPLQVVLNISNDQANATFSAAQPEVRQALEAALPKLREMMGDAGIQLGETTINAGTANQQDNAGGSSHQTARGFNGRNEQPDSPIQTSSIPVRASGLGLVDTFA